MVCRYVTTDIPIPFGKAKYEVLYHSISLPFDVAFFLRKVP